MSEIEIDPDEVLVHHFETIISYFNRSDNYQYLLDLVKELKEKMTSLNRAFRIRTEGLDTKDPSFLEILEDHFRKISILEDKLKKEILGVRKK